MTNEEKLIEINELKSIITEMKEKNENGDFDIEENDRLITFSAINSEKTFKIKQGDLKLIRKNYKGLMNFYSELVNGNEQAIIDAAIIGCNLSDVEANIIFKANFNYYGLRDYIINVVHSDLDINSIMISHYQFKIDELEGKKQEKGKF